MPERGLKGPVEDHGPLLSSLGVEIPDELLTLALELGCLFSIDSDAHAPGQLDFLDHGAARAAALGVPAERIVTTWPLEQLLTWTRTRRAPG